MRKDMALTGLIKGLTDLLGVLFFHLRANMGAREASVTTKNAHVCAVARIFSGFRK